MGRAIAIAFFLVLFSIGFVLLQLWTRRPTGVTAATPPRTQPMFATRDDGSVYAVSLQLTQFEKRLVEEEERSRKLLQELETLRKERTDLGQEVDQLQGEIQRLRRQVAERDRPAPSPANAPGNAPVTPVTPPDGNPVTPGTTAPAGG
jgi:peptidoglycan hydrolase CwlO-like protein